jgi:ABC-2 type transport system ATP-binding protein
MTEAIRLREIRKSYRAGFWLRRTPVLKGISLSVERGEIHGFLGPNGAGKTTTLKILTSLVHPDGGDVSILGRDGADPASRAAIGYLPEHPYFYDYLTASEFLRFAASLAGAPRPSEDDLLRLLARVGLPGASSTALRKFSKGMLQRVGVAQALVADPEILIFDEPMSGLDPIGRAEMRELILSLREGGKTVLFSTHILSDLEQVVDRVSIIHRGEMVASGPIGELLRESVARHRLRFREKGEGAERELSVDGEEALQREIDALRGRGATVDAVIPVRKSLEDLFQERVGEGRG